MMIIIDFTVDIYVAHTTETDTLVLLLSLTLITHTIDIAPPTIAVYVLQISCVLAYDLIWYHKLCNCWMPYDKAAIQVRMKFFLTFVSSQNDINFSDMCNYIILYIATRVHWLMEKFRFKCIMWSSYFWLHDYNDSLLNQEMYRRNVLAISWSQKSS